MKTARWSPSNSLPDTHRCASYGTVWLPPVRLLTAAAIAPCGGGSGRQNCEQIRYEGEQCRDTHPLPERAQGVIAGEGGRFRDHVSSSDLAVRSARQRPLWRALQESYQPATGATPLNLLREIPREHRKSTAPGV